MPGMMMASRRMFPQARPRMGTMVNRGRPPMARPQQGGLSSNGAPAQAASPVNRLPMVAGAAGVIPGYADGGAIPDPDNDMDNDMSAQTDTDQDAGGGVDDALDVINNVIDHGRKKHGLADSFRRSDNVEDDRNKMSGFGALAIKDMAGGDATNINGGVIAADPIDRFNKFLGNAATAGIRKLAGVDDQNDDSADLAIPGTLQEQAGANDIRSNYPPTSYAEGGTVEDDDDESDDGDSTGAIPDDASGPSDQDASQAVGNSPDPQRMVSYLMGADAAPPQMVAAIEHSIDPQGQMDPDTRHILAVQQATKQGGPDAGWSVIQNYRKNYDARRSFAAAALNGVAGKPPDVMAATQAATQAYSYLPDGMNISFQPSQAGGITATVKPMGGQGGGGSVDLTPEQFNEFVRGRSGQYDNVYEKGAPQVLAQLKSGQGKPFDQQGGQQQPQQGSEAPGAQSPLEMMGGSSVAQPGDRYQPAATNYDPQLEARSREMFPMLSQNAQRLQWLNQQEQQQRENDISEKKAGRPWEAEKAKANQEGRLAVAKQYSGSRENVAAANNATKLTIAGLNSAMRSGDVQLQADARLVASMNNSPNGAPDPDTPQGKAFGAAIQRLLRYQYSNAGGVNQQRQSGSPQGGTTPPAGHPNARKDPQGVWRERAPDGKWYPIQK